MVLKYNIEHINRETERREKERDRGKRGGGGISLYCIGFGWLKT